VERYSELGKIGKAAIRLAKWGSGLTKRRVSPHGEKKKKAQNATPNKGEGDVKRAYKGKGDDETLEGEGPKQRSKERKKKGRGEIEKKEK